MDLVEELAQRPRALRPVGVREPVAGVRDHREAGPRHHAQPLDLSRPPWEMHLLAVGVE